MGVRCCGRGRSIGAGALVLLVAACGGTGQSTDTLDPLSGPQGDTGAAAAATLAGPATTGATEIDPAQAGSGFVSLSVSVATEGIDETLALDRASVRAEDLDPLSLNAACSTLDGGDVLSVAVIDLRRLATGSRLVSATVTTDDPLTGPGEYPGAVEIADIEQQTMRFAAMVTVADGAGFGGFEGEDGAGNLVTGSFVCADQPIAAPPTTFAADIGEEVPGSTPDTTTE